MAEDTNLKFAKRWCHVTHFSNFGTRNISETARLKIQTSNFACRLIIGDTKRKNEKLSKRGMA